MAIQVISMPRDAVEIDHAALDRRAPLAMTAVCPGPAMADGGVLRSSDRPMPDFFPLARPLLRRMDAERAHRLSLWALKSGLVGGGGGPVDPVLGQSLWGLDFASPLGLAAGADKNAEVPAAMLRLGFGLVEVGTLTPLPQPGNPKPRMFRLAPDRAVINRLGFNNEGLEAGAARLQRLGPRAGPIGVNVGANKDAADPIADYVRGVERMAPLADYLTINVSSPNTPGLRDLQARARLEELVDRVLEARARAARQPPILVKLAPDLDDAGLAEAAEVLLAGGVDGAILGNTTVGMRKGLWSPLGREAGGLSGRPLFGLATARLARLYRLTGGRLPLVGVGGIESAETAYAKIRAGASLVQLYTALAFEGPGLVARINHGLAHRLKRDGFDRVQDAVGLDAAEIAP